MKNNTKIKIFKNDIITLRITSMSFAGMGIARYTNAEKCAENFIFFVKSAVVGDEVECVVLKTEKTYGYAKILRIISPSPRRIQALCPVFGKCGGCSFLNTDYSAELEYKKKIVADAFAKVNVSLPEIVVEGSPETEFYRNKVIYPISQDGKFGFYAENSHRVCVCSECRLQAKEFALIAAKTEALIAKYNVKPYNEATAEGVFRQLYMRRGKHSGQILVCFVIAADTLPHSDEFVNELKSIDGVASIYVNVNKTKGNAVLGSDYTLLWGEEKLHETLYGINFEISPASFWQINTLQAENLYNYAIASAEISHDDVVLDLYCGTGSITLCIAEKAHPKRVIGVEVVAPAIENAKRNALINSISSADFCVADAADTSQVVRKLCRGGNLPNVIFVDPPRKGLDENATAAIKALAPEKLVYVSCDPHTQARDIARLTADGSYSVIASRAFDMFPRTPHVESVVTLKKN